MRALDSFREIYLHRDPVDGRKQINGLAVIIQSSIGHSPFGGGLFAFTSKARDTVRLVYWDRTGFAMWVKRLEKEKFKWPRKDQKAVLTLSERELSWLLDGLDIARTLPHKTLEFEFMK